MTHLHTLRIALVALVVLGATGCADDTTTTSVTPAPAAATATTAATATKVVRVTVVGPDERLARGYIASPAVKGSCQPGSAAIGAAYRCFSGHTVLDPCFPGRDAQGARRVFCLPTPDGHRVAALTVRDLPALPADAKLVTTLPWGIELTDGTRCLIVQGAADLVAGKPVGWTCGHTRVLARDVRRGARWTVSAYAYKTAKPTYPARYRALGRVPITRVWFGTAAAGA